MMLWTVFGWQMNRYSELPKMNFAHCLAHVLDMSTQSFSTVNRVLELYVLVHRPMLMALPVWLSMQQLLLFHNHWIATINSIRFSIYCMRFPHWCSAGQLQLSMHYHRYDRNWLLSMTTMQFHFHLIFCANCERHRNQLIPNEIQSTLKAASIL